MRLHSTVDYAMLMAADVLTLALTAPCSYLISNYARKFFIKAYIISQTENQYFFYYSVESRSVARRIVGRTAIAIFLSGRAYERCGFNHWVI